MPATAAPSWQQPVALIRTLLALLVGCGAAFSAWAQDAPANKPILAPPPTAWNAAMLSSHPLFSHTVTDFAAITAGITFGMGPAEVNAHMANPAKGIAWSVLPNATEFQDEVRYFWVRFADAHDLHAGSTACAGPDSYIVFLFRPRGLFRISYRLLPGADCVSPTDAAEQVFGRYVTISTDVALSVHYRARTMEIIDVTDPAASLLKSTRWQPRAEQ